MKSMEGKLQKYRQKPEPMGRESSLLAVRIHVPRGSRQDLGPIATCGVASGRFLGSSKHETSGWGEASRIAFTGPSRPPKNSPISFILPQAADSYRQSMAGWILRSRTPAVS